MSVLSSSGLCTKRINSVEWQFKKKVYQYIVHVNWQFILQGTNVTWLFTSNDKASVVPFSCSDSINVFSTLGIAFARYILIGCWKNLIDTLSTPLTGRMAGSSKGLAFILGAEGAKEQNQKEKDSICVSLDGLRRAARLSCALGEAAWGMSWQTHRIGW